MRFRLITLVCVGIAMAAAGHADAQYYYNSPYGRESPTAGLLSGRAAMTNAAAAVVSSQAAMAKAVGDAAGSNVKALESLESARGRAIENSVKATSTFYEKRKLYDAYQGLTAGQRPSREDMLRYSRDALAVRLDPSQVDPQGNVRWPELFLRAEFDEARAQIDFMFSQRTSQPTDAGSDLERNARTAVSQMRRGLRPMMSELTPPEYAAARRFLDAIALEVQLGPRAEALLKTAEVPPPGGSKVAGK